MSDLITKPYNDTVFGGVSWSHDFKRCIFAGEKPEPKFKTHFSDKAPIEEKKDEKASEEKKDEKSSKKEDKAAEDKFLLKESFGETLIDKMNPCLFIFDIENNKLSQVEFSFPDSTD